MLLDLITLIPFAFKRSRSLSSDHFTANENKILQNVIYTIHFIRWFYSKYFFLLFFPLICSVYKYVLYFYSFYGFCRQQQGHRIEHHQRQTLHLVVGARKDLQHRFTFLHFLYINFLHFFGSCFVYVFCRRFFP